MNVAAIGRCHQILFAGSAHFAFGRGEGDIGTNNQRIIAGEHIGLAQCHFFLRHLQHVGANIADQPIFARLASLILPIATIVNTTNTQRLIGTDNYR
jgi:hypothetical protein